MSYIIVTRNPRSGKVIVIDDGTENVAEYATEDEADAAKTNIPVCRAWGCQTIEVD